MGIFLDFANVSFDKGAFAGSAAGAGLVALILAFLAVFVIIALALYIYSSFAYMAIARKDKQSSPGLAWIPGVGPGIVSFRASGMHWWPWLLIIGFFIPYINIIAIILFAVYSVIWQWKMFEAIDKPGWWALLCLIPIVNLVLIGIAAWSKK